MPCLTVVNKVTHTYLLEQVYLVDFLFEAIMPTLKHSQTQFTNGHKQGIAIVCAYNQ